MQQECNLAISTLLLISLAALSGCGASEQTDEPAADAGVATSAETQPQRSKGTELDSPGVDIKVSGALTAVYERPSWALTEYSPPASGPRHEGFVLLVYEQPMTDFKQQLHISPIPWDLKTNDPIPVTVKAMPDSVTVNYVANGLNRESPGQWVGVSGTLVVEEYDEEFSGTLDVGLAPKPAGAAHPEPGTEPSAQVRLRFQGLRAIHQR